MVAVGSVPEGHLEWLSTTVHGRRANYGAGGEGLPVLFLHGWALGQHSYKRALKRLVQHGCRVYAPALPGSRGTADLPPGQRGLPGYAAWAADFLEAVGVGEPALVVGHSFGGAVAIKLAYEHPERVGALVLVDAVGGATWRSSGGAVRSMSERPLWDWGLHFPEDLWEYRAALPVARAVLEDALPNLFGNPAALWRVANLARTTDLTYELTALRRRRLPATVLWGDRDGLVTRACFEATCAALGVRGTVVRGRHSWPLADPDAFAAAMAAPLASAGRQRELRARSRRTGRAARGA